MPRSRSSRMMALYTRRHQSEMRLFAREYPARHIPRSTPARRGDWIASVVLGLMFAGSNGADIVKSVWQGAYTKEQAARGKARYLSELLGLLSFCLA
jgi:hypothetical protein